MNYKTLGYILIVTAILIFILSCIEPSSAFVINYNGVDYEVNPVNSVSAPVEQPPNFTYDFTPYQLNPQYRPQQGQTVYVNDTIDIYGMGWGSGLAWYGKYGEYNDPQYIRVFTAYPIDRKAFWLEPRIFASRPGMWYQYYGSNTTEKNGNLAAFYVTEGYRNSTLTFSNGTVVNKAVAISNVSDEAWIPKNPLLPEVRVSDYVLARGDTMTIDDDTDEKIWMFGRNTQCYDYETVNGSITYDSTITGGFEPGTYYILKQYAGKNNEYDVRFYNDQIQWKNGWSRIESINIPGVQPKLVVDKVIEAIKHTDDTYWMGKMEVQDPAISITQIDEVDVGGRIPIAWEPGLTLLDVRGYTNVANGTRLKFVMDPDKQTARTINQSTFTTEAVRAYPGNMSYYKVYIPINKNNMPNGMHTIKVTTAVGGEMLHDFEVSELPADSYVPNATVKYIGDRNPWIPTPTPEVVTVVQTQVIEKIVMVKVTPSNEVVLEQQRIAQKEVIDAWVYRGVVGVVLLIGLLFGGWYAMTIWRRVK